MNGKQLIKVLKAHGWQLDRIRGSHYILMKEGRRSIPIAVHGNKNLLAGLIRAIIKQAGLNKSNLK